MKSVRIAIGDGMQVVSDAIVSKRLFGHADVDGAVLERGISTGFASVVSIIIISCLGS